MATPPRFFVDLPLQADTVFTLPPGPARHVQVLRLQPGAAVTLFDGRGGEWRAQVESIGRREVEVRLEALVAVNRELAFDVTLAIGMPANERMDTVIEKATELGVARIQPLVCERSVLRLAGERAEKKAAHWQAVAVAACEQSGRTRLATVLPVATLASWLGGLPPEAGAARWLLSPRATRPLTNADPLPLRAAVVCLSGPEGGLSDAEEVAAQQRGFMPFSLGDRILRADTAPLAVLAWLALGAGARAGQ